MTNRFEARWEQQLRRIRMPHMDVHDRVMNGIRADGQGMAKGQKRARVWAIPAMILLVALGTGFAYVGAVYLFDQTGEQVLTIDNRDTDSLVTPEEWSYYEQFARPGETVVIYKPHNNPQKIVSSYTKPNKVYTYDVLVSLVGTRYALPASVPDGFRFEEGFAGTHPNIPHELTVEMRAQGDESGETVMRILADDSGDPVNATLTFDQAGEEYTLTVTDGDRWETLYTDRSRHSSYDVVMIGGVQGYVATVDDIQKLYWRSAGDEQSLFYLLSTTDMSELGQQRLVHLLESFVLPE